MSDHHNFSQSRPARPFGQRQQNRLQGGLHEQLNAIETDAPQGRRGLTLRLALGFAAFGIAVALWAGPNIEDTAYRVALAFQSNADDGLTTASIGRPSSGRPASARPYASADPSRSDGTRRYVERRSVLQAPGEVCFIQRAGETCR